MPEQGSIVIVGGTHGLGLEVGKHFADQGRDVVVTGRDTTRAQNAAKEIGGRTRGIRLDLARAGDIARALRLVTLKLVGYTEVVHALHPRLGPDSAILIFGGEAKDKPYGGSTVVPTVTAGATGLARTLGWEM